MSTTNGIFVDPTTGNVGIGTTNPQAKLHIQGNIISKSQPSFRAYRTGTSITISSAIALPYNEVAHNIGNHYNTSTYIFTVPITGVYYFSASSYMNDAQNSMYDIIYDGTIYERAEFNFDANQNSINRLSTIIYCESGKTVFVRWAAGNVYLIANERYIHFLGHLLS